MGEEGVEIIVETDTGELGDGLGTRVEVIGEGGSDVVDQLIDVGHWVGDLGKIDEVLEVGTVFEEEGHQARIVVKEVDDIGVLIDQINERNFILVQIVREGSDEGVEDRRCGKLILVDVVVVRLLDNVVQGGIGLVDVGGSSGDGLCGGCGYGRETEWGGSVQTGWVKATRGHCMVTVFYRMYYL